MSSGSAKFSRSPSSAAVADDPVVTDGAPAPVRRSETRARAACAHRPATDRAAAPAVSSGQLCKPADAQSVTRVIFLNSNTCPSGSRCMLGGNHDDHSRDLRSPAALCTPGDRTPARAVTERRRRPLRKRPSCAIAACPSIARVQVLRMSACTAYGCARFQQGFRDPVFGSAARMSVCRRR